MTKEQYLALTLARKRIQNGEVRYICWALDDVAEDHPELTTACKSLQLYILDELGPSSISLGGWQSDHGIMRDDIGRQRDRVDWISWMLGELE